MPDFIPPPPVADNWRDHIDWSGPTCRECGHPLWAYKSVRQGACFGCKPYPLDCYDGPPHLRIVGA